MNLNFQNFIFNLKNNPTLCIITILMISVILVNGWTDAPNAIATCISTRSIRPKKAIFMAAFFNFLGVFIMTLISSNVAQTIYNIANFGNNSVYALISLCAGLIAIVLWAVVAWLFGIPTSESHALVAGISGAAIAINKGLAGVNLNEWKKVIIGLVLSTILGFLFGYILTKIIEKICKNMDRTKLLPIFKKFQVFSGGAMAFMHGAQDGQKFIGIFLLGITLANGLAASSRKCRSSNLANAFMLNCNDNRNFSRWIQNYKNCRIENGKTRTIPRKFSRFSKCYSTSYF